MKIDKIWGFYEDLLRSDNLVVKRLVILPGQKISYQRHHCRDEYWTIIKGEGLLCLNDKIKDVKEKSSFIIIKEDWHQIKNISEIDLECIEIQTGICYEEDIERKEDKL